MTDTPQPTTAPSDHDFDLERDRALAKVQAEFCRMMGNPSRLLILYALRDQERCVSDLAELLEAPQPGVSQHLAAMRKLGIVQTRRQGQHMFYSLTDPNISNACDMIRGILQRNMQHRSNLFAAETNG